MVTEPPALSFAGLLRQLRAEAKLTQEELAAAAGVSPRSVSNLERGINRTAHKDTAVLLAGALGLTEPTEELFVAAARGNVPPAQVLAAAEGAAPRPASGDRFPVPRAGRVRGAGRGVVFRPGSGRHRAAGADVAAAGGRGRCWWCPGRRARGSRRCCGRGCCRGSGRRGLASAPGAAWWPWVVFTPTRAPLDELALRVAPLAGTDASAVRRGLAADPAWFALTARQAALARPRGPAGDPDGRSAERDQLRQRRLLLVVDQFEELFTQCAEEGQRRAFITALHAAATAGHGPDQTPAALVVLGVRADFEARCADYPQLAGPVQDRYLVTAMTGRQLRMAITEPAKKAGSKVDDDLAEPAAGRGAHRPARDFRRGGAAVAVARPGPGLAQPDRSKPLTLADYERTGGIEGAVAASAQRAYDGLTPAQQAAARQVFMRLTATSSDGVDYRRPRHQGGADRRQEPSRGPGCGGGAGGLRRRTAAHPGRRHRGTQPRSAADRLAAAARHLARRHPRRPDRPHPAAHHRRRAGHATPATRPTSTAAACWQAATGTATRIGADPARHPPLSQTERDFLHASSHAHRRTVRRWQAVIAGLLALTWRRHRRRDRRLQRRHRRAQRCQRRAQRC